MVTDRDLIARVVAAGRDPKSMKVEDVDTHDLVTIGPDQDLEEARRMMAQHQLDRLWSWRGTTSWSASFRRRISAPMRAH
jgi:signal-transduction protein with cAMP-binding, CBS, and nucleotidyltransferase domain